MEPVPPWGASPFAPPADRVLHDIDGVYLRSKHLVLRRSVDASADDFADSTEWQDYLRATVRSDLRHGPVLISVQDDAEDYSFKGGRRKDGRIYATVTIPSAWLDKPSAYENSDVYRAVKARLFADLAAAADLPTPPPLPRKLPPLDEKVAPGAGVAF
ncbi:MAG: hypothetical protein FWE71_14760, partial [Nocardioidaceae bacterium]|nr:hypothetical protein [Nocardioidaceae bacterium]